MKAACDLAGLSSDQVGTRLRVSGWVVRSWFRGESPIRLNHLVGFAGLVGVSVGSFFSGSGADLPQLVSDLRFLIERLDSLSGCAGLSRGQILDEVGRNWCLDSEQLPSVGCFLDALSAGFSGDVSLFPAAASILDSSGLSMPGDDDDCGVFPRPLAGHFRAPGGDSGRSGLNLGGLRPRRSSGGG
jgi:hypothetical protein